MHRFVFVLEQTLGHVAHSRNLVRALAGRPDIDPTIIPIPFAPAGRAHRMPGLRNWSLRASRATRAALGRRLAERPADAIFIHTQVASLLSAGIMNRVPTVVSLDATPINFDGVAEAYGHSRQPSLIESVKRTINRRALGRAAALVTWADWATTSLVTDYGIHPRTIHTIHPGVDLDLFQPRAHSRGGAVRLLFVGGDFGRKGGHELLDALAHLGPGVEADIVTPRVEGAPPGARFRHHPGLQPQSAALLSLYGSADVFVLPARGDCFPQAIAEAMASGLPVIATRVGAIPEMVRDGENGFLVRPGSREDLVRAIRTLAEDEGLRRRMGQSARNLAVSRHDAIRNANRIFDLMTAVSAADRSFSLVASARSARA